MIRPGPLLLPAALLALLASAPGDLRASSGRSAEDHLSANLDVAHGSGSGRHRIQTSVSISANNPSGKSVFLGWIKLSEGDGEIADPHAQSTTFELGEDDAKVTAVFAELEKTWFPPGPQDNTKGLLLPRPSGGGPPPRLEHAFRVKITADFEAPTDKIRGLFDVELKWEQSSHAKFFDQEEGGRSLASAQPLPPELLKQEGQHNFKATLYYEGAYNPADHETPPTVQLTLTLKPKKANSSSPQTLSASLLPVQIEEVSFGGTKYWELKSDDAATTYSAPQWKDVDGNGKPTNTAQGERDYAVAFTRNTKPMIGAKFKIPSASNFGAIKIKATGPGGVAIPETAASVSGDVVTLPLTEASSELVNTIKFYDKKDDAKAFKLEWEVKIGNSDWSKIGTTNHTVYVTLDDPKTSLRQESLFEISCRNADGINRTTPVTDAIWNEFTDRVVKRVDGVQLTYYNEYTCNYVTTEDLLKFGDGQCGAWAKFFIDLRKVQGIDDTNEYVMFQPAAADGFIVKNWNFSGSGTSGISGFPYLNIPDSNFIRTNSYNWKFAQVTDAQGIPGQGNANPASLFNNHQVVIAGQYYDPSYGVKHASLQDIDDNAIDGFYIGPGLHPVGEPAVNLDLNNDGDKTDMGVNTVIMAFKKNPPGLDLIEIRIDY